MSDAPGNLSQPTQIPAIPDYDLLRCIGRGAYGEVWLARSKATGVLRAAKTVWRHRFEDERPFHREFEGIQRFEQISREHPSQLALFHIGRNDAEAYFYYLMELADNAIDGDRFPRPKSPRSSPTTANRTADARETTTSKPAIADSAKYSPHTLRAELAAGRLTAARALEIGLALAEALEHLHAHGLVHRDVKPSNVIFVSGRPKLADIGLVTDASDDCSIVGTEGYLPREGPGTPQADIFALGKVIYEATTGLDRRQYPDLPPEIKDWPDAELRLELNQIVLKACTTDLAQRYGNVEQMQQDLSHLAEGKSILGAQRAARRSRLAKRLALFALLAAAGSAFMVFGGRLKQLVFPGYTEPRSTNELANHFFVLGREHFDMFSGTHFQVASDYFTKAVQLDTNFAAAYGLISATLFWSDEDWNPRWGKLPQAKGMAMRALALNDRLAEPHLALGWYYGMHEWNWREAEKHDKRAIALNPTSPFCHLCYGELLRMMGRVDEALQQIYEAKAQDSHSRIINMRLTHYLICAKRFNEALAQIDRIEVMGKARDTPERDEVFLAQRQPEKALEEQKRQRLAAGESPEQVESDIAKIKRGGINAIWRNSLEYHNQRNELFDAAGCYAQLGQTNAAIACLDKLLEQRDTGLTFEIMTDWRLDPIRSVPRFHEILQKMHFE